jgi:DNA-binding response OmpR family regulator
MRWSRPVRINGEQPKVPVSKNPFFTTLLINDLDGMDRALERFMRAEGHSVIRASSAAEALSQTREFQPDLILLDSQMGGKSTLALLPKLLLEQLSAAVIVLAPRPRSEDAVESLKLGAADFFERPLDLGRLKQAIDLQKKLFSRGTP